MASFLLPTQNWALFWAKVGKNEWLTGCFRPKAAKNFVFDLFKRPWRPSWVIVIGPAAKGALESPGGLCKKSHQKSGVWGRRPQKIFKVSFWIENGPLPPDVTTKIARSGARGH